MRIPESASRTTNAYLAFRAVLLAVEKFNETASDGMVIDSLVCPGLCTGIGGMDCQQCAIQMRMAFRNATGPARIPSFDHIHKVHDVLVRG